MTEFPRLYSTLSEKLALSPCKDIYAVTMGLVNISQTSELDSFYPLIKMFHKIEALFVFG
jgi:hypothetical protein